MASEYGGTEIFGRQPSKPPASGKGGRPAREPWRPRYLLGVLALLAALFTVVVTAIGIAVAMDQRWLVGTWLAYLATGTSVVAVICGAASVVTKRGRGWGAMAIVIGVLASPPILTNLLRIASGLG